MLSLSACHTTSAKLFEDVKILYREESNKIDNNIEALLQIQRDQLELEWQRLEFEREKAGLTGTCISIL